MNRQPEELLEEFPSRDGPVLASSLAVQKAKCRFLSLRKSSSDFESSSSSLDSSSFSSPTSNRIDPICIARIAGDSMEFRQLQEELRKSKIITGANQLMKAYVEKQGRQIEEKRNSDPELRKVKKLVKKRSIRNLLMKSSKGRDFSFRISSLANLVHTNDERTNS